MESTWNGKYFGHYFIPIKPIFKVLIGVCPLLPEVYSSVVSLHSLSLLFIYFFISVSTPTGLCKLLEGGCYAIAYYYSYLDLNFKSKFCFKPKGVTCRVVSDTELGVPMSSVEWAQHRCFVYIVDPNLASAKALQVSNNEYLGQFSHDCS